MRDIDLYRHLLGLEDPWFASDVQLDVQEQRLDDLSVFGYSTRKPEGGYGAVAPRRNMIETEFALESIGNIRSALTTREAAPKQGSEGGIDAWIEIHPSFAEGLEGIAVGSDVILVTWLHKASRNRLRVHPRGDQSRPITGVFSTRSPDRPNPIGLHRVTVREITGNRLRVGPIEAIDGTPVVDIKPVLPRLADS